MLCGVSLVAAAHAHAAPVDAPKAEIKKCDDALKATTEPYRKAASAGHFGEVDKILDRAEVACSDQPLPLQMIDATRALSAYDAGDDRRVLEILHKRGVTRESLFFLSARLVEAAALKRSGDDAGYRAVRDKLIAANIEGLTTGPEPYMKKGEALDTPYARIDVFEEIPRGRGLREIFLFAVPRNGAMPISVSYSFKVDDKGRQGAPLGHMDLTYCDGNFLIVNDGGAETEAALNAQAARRLSASPPPTPIAAKNGHPAVVDDSFSLSVCDQATFIFRGIDQPQ
jgi:hypothetical protein